MNGIVLVDVGLLSGESAAVLSELAGFLGEETGLETRVSERRLDVGMAYDEARGQYRTQPLLSALDAWSAEASVRVLGVTEMDLMSPLFTFVFGEAVLRGKSALVSLHRLRPERYGLRADPAEAEARLRRVALHELGHLAGLVHCREPECVMRFSGAAEEVDLTRDAFCQVCRCRFQEWSQRGMHV